MGRRATVTLLALLPLAGCASEEPDPTPVEPVAELWFEERAAASGIDFAHRSGFEERYLFPEIVAGGVALFDMDDDGDLDAYLVQSGSVVNPGGADAANRLYRNEGSGRFVDVTAESGAGDRGYGIGVTFGDYDGDGDEDLYVANLADDVLLRNDGAGVFQDVTAEVGLSNPSWGNSAAFVDVDGDRDLDLFVTNYVNWSLRSEVECFNSSGSPDYCLPTNYKAPAMDRLFLNEGGRFLDVSVERGLSTAFGNGMGVVVNDFDRDGDADVFVANDTMENQLWVNDGRGFFTDEALLRGCALDDNGKEKAGMGVASEDFDFDGDMDLLVVNLEAQTDSFFENDGGGYFSDNTGTTGLAQTSKRHTRFGLGLVDFDRDGLLDCFQANGRVSRNAARPDRPFDEPNVLYRGLPGGRFAIVEPAAGMRPSPDATSRGAAFGDVDDDGDLDVLVLNKDAPAHLLVNVRPQVRGLARLDLRETGGGAALGAQVHFLLEGRPQVRVARSAFSYASASDPRIDVAVPEGGRLEQVVVTWTDGTTQSFGDLEAGRTHRLERAAP